MPSPVNDSGVLLRVPTTGVVWLCRAGFCVAVEVAGASEQVPPFQEPVIILPDSMVAIVREDAVVGYVDSEAFGGAANADAFAEPREDAPEEFNVTGTVDADELAGAGGAPFRQDYEIIVPGDVIDLDGLQTLIDAARARGQRVVVTARPEI